MSIEREPDATTVFGKVRLADGSLPRSIELMFNVNVFAQVRALEASGEPIVSPAYVNNYGDYILPQVPTGDSVDLEASMEKTAITQRLDTEDPPLFQEVDFVLPNHPPEPTGFVSGNPGGELWTARPGDTITIAAPASDEDGDDLEYLWLLPDGSSVLRSPDNETIQHTLPDREGLYEFTVLVFDNKGGYAKDSISVSTEGVRLSGTVSATNAPGVEDAEVEVNGKRVKTNSEGYFEMFVEESPRYVLNIRNQGYQLLPKIYDGAQIGDTWTLTRASVTSEDPTRDIQITNKRQSSDCPGSLTSRADPNNEQRGCGPGIRVRIPANSLVDADGRPPDGKVEVALSTIDVESPDGMPGDFTAIDRNGNRRVMETYGAGFIEITSAGREYNLDRRQGAKAEVIIPIAPSVFAAGAPIPSRIPLLFYDESEGVWREEGVANRVGNAYVGTVNHFSAINVDLLLTNQACLRLETVAMPQKFKLEWKVLPPPGGGTTTTKTEPIDNSARRFHVLYNLPTTGTIELRAYEDKADPPNLIKFLDIRTFVETGERKSVDVITESNIPPQSPPPTSFLEVPAFPYNACQRSVELTPFRFPTPSDHKSTSAANFFLAFLDFKAANLNELDPKFLAPEPPGSFTTPWVKAANEYYETIDPLGLRQDLEEFKRQNGFPSSDEIRATYANSADLGFGRDMHCRRQTVSGMPGFDFACYVTNYGNRFTDDVDDFAKAVGNKEPIASVAMEYSRIEKRTDGFSDERIVKFYVFKNAVRDPHDRGFGRVPTADLDGLGERPVPQLCMVCHGGSYPGDGIPTRDINDFETADLKSNFLPFDLTGLTTPIHNGIDYKETQQEEFKKLNTEIVKEAGNTPAILEVINKMYDEPGFPPADQIEGFVVAGWDNESRPTPTDPNQPREPSPKEVYITVVAPSCRTCHIAQRSDIAWNMASQWRSGREGQIAYYVCESHVMPHAFVTHNRFWLSDNPHQPEQLHNYPNGGQCIGIGTGSSCAPSSAP
jgi:hypothetical protein